MQPSRLRSCRNVDAGSSLWVGPRRVSNALPADIRAQRLDRHPAIGAALNGGAAIGRNAACSPGKHAGRLNAAHAGNGDDAAEFINGGGAHVLNFSARESKTQAGAKVARATTMKMDIKAIRLANLQTLLDERKCSKAAFAELIGVHPSQVSQWLSGFRTISEETARSMEHALGKPNGWMDVPKHPRNKTTNGNGFTHGVGPASPMIEPITLAWGPTLLSPLPPLFRLVIQDDSMGADYQRGCTVTFSTTEGQPRPRDLVLVVDADQQIYFREYQAGRAGRWQAVALSSGYQPLDSEADGLRVLAVSMGRWGRRG